jgi:hypothetical protein
MTLDYLVSKYGMRMSAKELSSELKMSYSTLMHKRQAGQLDVKLYKDGGAVFADVRDVADYLDSKRAAA